MGNGMSFLQKSDFIAGMKSLEAALNKEIPKKFLNVWYSRLARFKTNQFSGGIEWLIEHPPRYTLKLADLIDACKHCKSDGASSGKKLTKFANPGCTTCDGTGWKKSLAYADKGYSAVTRCDCMWMITAASE